MKIDIPIRWRGIGPNGGILWVASSRTEFYGLVGDVVAVSPPTAPPVTPVTPNGVSEPVKPKRERKPVEPPMVLPEGFISLTAASNKQRANDPYAVLRGLVGKLLAITGVNIADDQKSGTAVARVLNVKTADDGTVTGEMEGDSYQFTIPKAALKMLIAAAGNVGEGKTITARVEATARGVALR